MDETQRISDLNLLISVIDTRNIIYLQEKIKNIELKTDIYNDYNLSTSFSRFGVQECFMNKYSNISCKSFVEFDNLDKLERDLHLFPILRYDYPSYFPLNSLDELSYSNNWDKSNLQNVYEFPYNSSCIICEPNKCMYLDENLLNSLNKIDNKLNENESQVIDVNLGIEIENLETNICDFEVVHTISEEFIVQNCNLRNTVKKKYSNLKATCQKQLYTYNCQICSKPFKSIANLKCHLRIHTNYRPYVCHFCKQSFKQANHLTSHIRRHTGERPFQCPICNSTFIQGTTLKVHINNKHAGKSFKSVQEQLKTNSNTALKKYSINNFNCEICKKTYIGVNKKEHFKTHVEKDHPCTVCSKSFKKLESYENHIKIHEPLLENYFTQSLNTKKQGTKRDKSMINKINITKHYCKFCDKAFGNKSNLLVHRRTHTGERPYKCNFCKISYKQISHLKYHMGLHAKNQSYVCSDCNNRFTDYNTAVKHVEKIHSAQETFIVKTFDNIQ